MKHLVCEASARLNRGPAIRQNSNQKEAWHLRTAKIRNAAILFALLIAVSIQVADAQPSQAVGFLSTLGGEVSNITSFNSAGGTNTVNIIGTGRFEVTFPGLGNAANSNIQVNAYVTDGTPHICTSQGWGSNNGTDVTAYVGCFDFAGNPFSDDFSIFYQARYASSGGWMGFIWADQPTAASYTPSSNWNYNNTGTPNTVTRASTGVYTATFPGLRGGGNAQVTAFTFQQGVSTHCEISGWSATGKTTAVGVLCFDGNGNPADEYFSLSYNRSVLASQGATNGVYAYAEKASARNYTPKFLFSEDGGMYPTTQRFGRVPGEYAFTVSNPASNTIKPFLGMISAVGTGGEYCMVEGYAELATSFGMEIVCYDSSEFSANVAYSGALFYNLP